MKHKYFIAALALVLFNSIPFIAAAQQKDYNVITFSQEDSSITINGSTGSVILGKAPFSILYYAKRYNSEKEQFHAMQVAVLKDAADTLLAGIGKNVKDIPYFEDGSGMAPGSRGLYDAVIVSNKGHHYLYYENEAERRVSRNAVVNDLLQLEWSISRMSVDDEDIEFADLDIPALYFVFFADRNLNEVIDAGELKIVKMIFR